jgi:hypothetical protein
LKAAIEVDEEYKRYRLSRTTQTANIQSTSKSARVSSVDYVSSIITRSNDSVSGDLK